MPKRAPKLYLDDIKTALKNIRRYMRGLDFIDLAADQKTIDAVVRNFEIIGEAARHLPKSFVARHPAVPWAKIIGMRNKIIHEYFGIDLEIIWKTIKDDLPELSKQLAKLR